MEKIINTIKSIISENNKAVIGIDGCCASGKTTFANKLANELGAQVIHMDDFFLPPQMRTPDRLSQAGGNVHYERFADEIVNGIKSGKEFEYRVFSCQSGTYEETKTVSPDKPIIIEGAYTFHPEIPDIYDLKLFIRVDCETQLERILQRNGSAALEVFKAKWIPFENRYFDTFKIESRCDLVINNQ